MKIEIKKVKGCVLSQLPAFATPGSAAVDLSANITEVLVVPAGGQLTIGTGIAINILDGNVAAMLLPRSGLGVKSGIVLGNLVGLIDSDYQGEIKVCLWNRSNEDFTVFPNDRIAQMVFVPVLRPEWQLVSEFSEQTERGTGGFGSTGV